MASPAVVDVAKVFVEVDKAVQAQHYERAVDLCETVLRAQPADREAALCKAVLLVKLARYDAALTFITRQTAVPADTLAFEHGYALYRLGRLREALDVLRSEDESSLPRRTKTLVAQVYYKLEEFAKAASLLRQLADEADPSSAEHQEILTNMYAARAAAGLPLEDKAQDPAADTFELNYNMSLCALASGDVVKAEQLVETAEEQCRATLSGDDLVDELAPILVQKAYICQVRGNLDEALQIYSDVIKSKPGDNAALAIASNNCVSIKQEKDLFDAAKKLKQAEAFLGKLSLRQRQIVDTNNTLVLMYMNKSQPCREQITVLQKKYASLASSWIISAALISREKKNPAAAIAELKMDKSAPDLARLCQAQLEAQQGQYDAALTTMLALPDAMRFRPVIAATIIALFDASKKGGEALSFLQEAIQKSNNKHLLLMAARYLSLYGSPSEAAKVYETVAAQDPNDVSAISGLIKTYAMSNPALAAKFEARLPSLNPTTDIDALEALVSHRHFRARNIAKDSTTTEAAPPSTEKGKPAAKKTRKRKPRLPKNYTPGAVVDPERWLPLKERSTYRKSKKQRDRDREMSKGASQGAAPTSDRTSANTSTKGGASSSATDAQAGKKKKR